MSKLLYAEYGFNPEGSHILLASLIYDLPIFQPP